MFQVRNIKLSIKVRELKTSKVLHYLQTNQRQHKIKANYVIVEERYVYIFFKHKNGTITHINVTKIPSSRHIKIAARILQVNLFKKFTVKILSVKIDNVTAVSDVERNLQLLKTANKMKEEYNISI